MTTQNDKVRCIRCLGRKKLYKVGAIYSMTNTGGKEVECPLCLGNGKIKKLEVVLKEINDNKDENSESQNVSTEMFVPEKKARRGRPPRNRDLIYG